MSEGQAEVSSPPQATARERFFDSAKLGVEAGSLEYTFLKTAMEIEEGRKFNETNPDFVETGAFLGIGELKEQLCKEFLSGGLGAEEFSAAQGRFLDLGNQAIDMYQASGAILETELLKNSIGKVGISNKDIVGYGESHGLEVPSEVRAKAHEETFEDTGQIEESKTRKRAWITGVRLLLQDLKDRDISKDEYNRIIELANQHAPEGLILEEEGVDGSLADRILRLTAKKGNRFERFKSLMGRRPTE